MFRKYNTVLFVNGCFWHGHENCKDFRLPKTRTEWWRDKIAGTVDRDRKKHEQLRAIGWRPLIVWQCELAEERMDSLYQAIVTA